MYEVLLFYQHCEKNLLSTRLRRYEYDQDTFVRFVF